MKSEVCVLNRPFFKFLCFALLLFMGIYQASGQDVELGIEYVKAGEYEKAKSIFQKLAKNKDIAGSIHKPYLQTLYKLKEVDEAEKFLKKQIKWSDGNPFYLIDYAHLLEEQKKKEEALKVEKVKFNEYVKKTFPKAKISPSGLAYIIEKTGTGENAKAGNNVSVHYIGELDNGKQFDSSYERSQPIEFVLGQGRVIPGWEEGIALLNKGAKVKLIIPYWLAYGESGRPPVIPEKATLIFNTELIEIK